MASKKTSGRPVVPTGRSGPSRKPARVRKTVSVRAPSPEKASSPKAMVVKRSPSSALERETSKVLSLKAEIARKFRNASDGSPSGEELCLTHAAIDASAVSVGGFSSLRERIRSICRRFVGLFDPDAIVGTLASNPGL